MKRTVTYGLSKTEFLQLFEGIMCQPSVASAQHISPFQIDPCSAAQVVSGLEPAQFVHHTENGRMDDLV